MENDAKLVGLVSSTPEASSRGPRVLHASAPARSSDCLVQADRRGESFAVRKIGGQDGDVDPEGEGRVLVTE